MKESRHTAPNSGPQRRQGDRPGRRRQRQQEEGVVIASAAANAFAIANPGVPMGSIEDPIGLGINFGTAYPCAVPMTRTPRSSISGPAAPAPLVIAAPAAPHPLASQIAARNADANPTADNEVDNKDNANGCHNATGTENKVAKMFLAVITSHYYKRYVQLAGGQAALTDVTSPEARSPAMQREPARPAGHHGQRPPAVAVAAKRALRRLALDEDLLAKYVEYVQHPNAPFDDFEDVVMCENGRDPLNKSSMRDFHKLHRDVNNALYKYDGPELKRRVIERAYHSTKKTHLRGTTYADDDGTPGPRRRTSLFRDKVVAKVRAAAHRHVKSLSKRSAKTGPLFTRTPLDRPMTPVDQVSFQTAYDKVPVRIETARATSEPITGDGLVLAKKRHTETGAQGTCHDSCARDDEILPRKLVASKGWTQQPVLPVMTDGFVVPKRFPPITTKTLEKYEVFEYMRDDQFRHDMLFEQPLLVRRNDSTARSSNNQDRMIEPAAAAESSSPDTERYWEAVAWEVRNGCRCSRWYPNGDGYLVKVNFCHCGRRKEWLDDNAWYADQANSAWPSRIPYLIKAIRDLVIDLMGRTTNCRCHLQQLLTGNPHPAHAPGAMCPVVTNALVPAVRRTLNAKTLTCRVRNGDWDIQPLQSLIDCIKVHCAPIRDPMANDILTTAHQDGPGAALRKVFDVLRVMKLDITQFQITAMRPQLLKRAPEHELELLEDFMSENWREVEQSVMLDWMRVAKLAVIRLAEPARRLHLVALCECRDTRELGARAIAHGILDVIYGDWEETIWPPISHQRLLQAGAVRGGRPHYAEHLPESLRLDVDRLRGFRAETVEIAMTNLILHKVLEVADWYRSPVRGAQLRAARKRIVTIIKDRFLDVRRDFDSHREISIRLAEFVVKAVNPNTAGAGTLTRDESVMLELAAQEIDAFITAISKRDSPVLINAFARVERMINERLHNSIRVGLGARNALCGDRQLKESLSTAIGQGLVVVNHHLYDADPASAYKWRSLDTPHVAPLFESASRASTAVRVEKAIHDHWAGQLREQEDQLSTSWGLQGVEGMIDEMVGRLVQLVNIHRACYREYYALNNMLGRVPYEEALRMAAYRETLTAAADAA